MGNQWVIGVGSGLVVVFIGLLWRYFAKQSQATDLILHEFKPNNGLSMRDAINRLEETRQADLERLDRLERRMDEIPGNVAALVRAELLRDLNPSTKPRTRPVSTAAKSRGR
jgi:hypothetical protein